MELKNIGHKEIEDIETRLEEFDEQHMGEVQEGRISIGYYDGEQLVAGIDGQMTSFHIFYISTLFVEETYRRKGIGKALLSEVEKRAVGLGANMIRLDTFDWQGKEFYSAMGYELAGSYQNEKDKFGEYFFYKMMG